MKHNYLKTQLQKLSLSLICFFALGYALDAQLITNGDLELWTGTCPVNTAPNSWTNYSTQLGPDQAGTCAGTVTSHSGSSHMNLVWINSGLREGATQTITGLTLGTQYRITMWAINNQGLYAAGGDVKVQIHQNSTSIFATPNLVSGGAWTSYSVDFTATSLSEVVGVRVLEGTNVAPGSGAAGVDDFMVSEIVGINDGLKQSVLVYPIPADDNLYITQGDYVTGVMNAVPFSVCDIVGKTVIQSTINFADGKARVDIASLNAGVYYLTWMIDGEQVSKKIVIR